MWKKVTVEHTQPRRQLPAWASRLGSEELTASTMPPSCPPSLVIAHQGSQTAVRIGPSDLKSVGKTFIVIMVAEPKKLMETWISSELRFGGRALDKPLTDPSTAWWTPSLERHSPSSWWLAWLWLLSGLWLPRRRRERSCGGNSRLGSSVGLRSQRRSSPAPCFPFELPKNAIKISKFSCFFFEFSKNLFQLVLLFLLLLFTFLGIPF